MRRIERLINLIAALLDTERPMTAAQIRAEIAGYGQDNDDAFRRSFERDKEALRSMGIPLELRSTGLLGDTEDAYIIPKDKYYLPDLDLEPEELAALRIAADAVMSGGDQAGAGLMKLSVGSPDETWGAPRVVWGADLAAEQPLLGPLYSSILDRKRISFSYARPEGAVQTRTVESYGLVHRRGNWYLVGRDVDRDDERSFKVSRIQGGIETLVEGYEIPDSFDAQAYVAREPWEIGGDEPTSAVVRFDPALAWWPAQNMPEATSRSSDDGGVEVELPVANIEALVSWALSFGDEVEILEPASARDALRAHLTGFLEEAR